MEKEFLLIFLVSIILFSGCIQNYESANETNNSTAENTEDDSTGAEAEKDFSQYAESRAGYEILSEKEKSLLPECDDTLMTASPVQLDSIIGIEPIGEANPPEHTLASISTDTYIAVQQGEMTPLVAPGDMWIIFIQPRYGVTQDPEDHVIKYAFCKDVYGVVDHVKEFSPEMLEIVNNFECRSSSAKPGDNQCPVLVLEHVKAGTPLGKVGGLQGNFNFGIWDLRITHQFINPASHGHLSLHSACPFDYYAHELREGLTNKIKRQGEGKCGTVMHDMPGTLQGDWAIGDASPIRPGEWDKLLFLGYDNDFPDQMIISASGIFVEQPTKWFITPESSGKINRKFGEVKDNSVYCYEKDDQYRDYGKGVQEGRMLIQLVNETHLNIEYQTGSCKDSQNWQFTNPTMYNR